MEKTKRVARASIPDREWVEFEVSLDDKGLIHSMTYRALGCRNLIESAGRCVKSFEKINLSQLQWKGLSHWDLLIAEALLRLKGEFQLPITEEELCHCRKIPTAKVDNAIVMGAQTPEKVRAWTQASSGCGTCRPNVEKLISYRVS